MKKQISIEFKREGLECSVDDNIAILNLTSDAFETLTNVDKDQDIFDWFNTVEENPAIGAILVLNEPNSLGNQAYNKFLSEISGKQIDTNNPEAITKFQKAQIRAIEINMLMNYIKRIVDFKKVFVAGLRGDIVTPFFGLSLAADLRFVDESTVFSLSHMKYSIHPSGALPFFLPRYVGHGKAVEYLLSGGDISANDAKQLGLVNKIIPAENFVCVCINETRKLLKLSKQYVKVTKTLLNFYKSDLTKYFEIESNYLFS